jgi:hypothetical protein
VKTLASAGKRWQALAGGTLRDKAEAAMTAGIDA